MPADYRLAVGDKLRVEVYKDAQLSQSLQVRPDGKITLPLVGDITAAGLTSIELRDQIASALKEYVTNPVVTVIVVETVPPVIYVMGEVAQPWRGSAERSHVGAAGVGNGRWLPRFCEYERHPCAAAERPGRRRRSRSTTSRPSRATATRCCCSPATP